MQTVSANFIASSGQNSTIHYPVYGVNISFTKEESESYQFFTIGTSSIGGPDFIPGSGSVPAFANQYQYTNYTQYMLSGSVTRSIGQYTYGAFGAQSEVQLDNTTLLFLPGYDATIGNYIITGRPINVALGFLDGTTMLSETINVFYGQTTAPMNDIGTRQITLDSFDGFDYLQSYQSKALGPIAAANSGSYVNQYANIIIGDLLSEAGFATSQYIAEQSSQAPIGYYSPYGLFIGDIIQALCEAEQAIFFFDENGIAHFWNRQHFINNSSPVWTFDETSIFELTPEDTPIINDVQIQANPRAVQVDQQIWQQSEATTIPAPTNTNVLTNLITNPSFETSLVGWTQYGGSPAGTLAQSTDFAFVGTYSAKIVNSASPSGGGFNGGMFYAATGLTVGKTYTIAVYVRGAVGGENLNIFVQNPGIQTTFTQTTTWTQHSQTFVANVTSTDIYIRSNTSNATWYADAVILELGLSAIYFDGSSPLSTSYLCAWTGTANLSTSTATPCGTVTVEADFEDDSGALPVATVDIPVWYTDTPNTSNYQVNTEDDNSGVDVQSFVSVVSTSLVNAPDTAAQLSGTSYFITFASSYPEPVYITGLTLWGTPAKVTAIINYEYQDQASIALYGDNPTNNGLPLLIQNDLIQSLSTAQSNATVLVTDYSTAYKRVTADVSPVPQIQIGDTVTVGNNDITNTSFQPFGLLAALTQQGQAYTFAPLGLLMAITQPQILPVYTEYMVVGITHTFSDDTPMGQMLELEEKILVNYFTIASSSIGGPDSLAPG